MFMAPTIELSLWQLTVTITDLLSPRAPYAKSFWLFDNLYSPVYKTISKYEKRKRKENLTTLTKVN